MASNFEETAKYEEIIERAQREGSKGHTAEDRKAIFKKSLSQSIVEVVQEKKNRSIHVILSMANSTIGSVALVLPASVLQGGVVLAIICMTIIGFINYATCYIVTVYQRENEIDLAQIVRRILGPKWGKALAGSSAFQLFVASIIYFLLINQILYPVIQFILHQSGTDNYGDVDEITFSKFSIQYQAIILFLPVFFLCSFRELNFIVKLGRIGVSSIFIYGIFLMYCFIDNIASGRASEHWDELKFFSGDIVGVAGPFSFAFFVHTVSAQITATNKEFVKNPRNIGFAYTIVYFAYAYFSIVGSIGVLGRSDDPSNATNINSFFTQDDVGPVIVDFLYLIHLLTALPTLCHVSRTQFFILVQGETKQVTKMQMFIFNATFCILGLIFQILCIDPSIVIEVNGAVCCFFIVYIIPFYMRLRYQKKNKLINTEESNISGKISENNDEEYFEEPLIQVPLTAADKALEPLRQTKMGILEIIFWVTAMGIGFFLAVATLLSVAGVNLD